MIETTTAPMQFMTTARPAAHRTVRLASTALLALTLFACAASPEQELVDRWEADIASFEAADRDEPPAPGSVLFVGSSSIRLWSTLATDFPGVPVINRGFGGSEMADALRYADRIILPYRPRMVVVYAGDNDLWNGKTPEQVFGDFRSLVQRIHDVLPETRVAFIAVKPSVARWRIEAEVRETNERVKGLADADPRIDYIDIFTPMLGAEGTPRPELFVEDGLHLNPQGYSLWASVVAPFLRVDGARLPLPRKPLLAGHLPEPGNDAMAGSIQLGV